MKRRPTFLKGRSLEIRDTGAPEQARRWKSTEQRGADAPRGGAMDTFAPHQVREKQKLGSGRGGASEGPTANQWPSLTAWAPGPLPPGPEDRGAPRQSSGSGQNPCPDRLVLRASAWV